VAGGGVRGCAAATAAARTGARTMLVERNNVLGGVATAGLMANIGNRYMDRDGRIVVGGVAREVIDRLVARGGASEKWACREVPGIVIDSEQLKIVLGEMLQEAGVQMLFHVLAARPIMSGNTVGGAFIETRTGRKAVRAKVVVDATGEADLAWQTGCPMRWVNGSASIEFKLGRVNLDALYLHFKAHPDTFPVGADMVKGFAEFERNWVERGIFFFPHGGAFTWDIFQRAVEAGEFQPKQGMLWSLNAAGLYGLRAADTVIVNSNFWTVDTLEPEKTTQATIEAQRACYYVADFFRRRVPGFDRSHIVQVAADPGIRVSRAIVGEADLTPAMVNAPKPLLRDDVVGRRPAGCSFKETREFFHPHSWDVPYGVVVPRGVENLLIGSGKSVSSDPPALDRGMSGCMVVGQAAGAAAALAAQQGRTPRALDVRSLQRTLVDQGVDLGDRDRLAQLGLR